MMNETKTPRTLQETIRYFSDDQVCIDFVASMRWEDGIAVCPHCANDTTYFLSTRKIWKCRSCKKQFSVKVGTIFEDSAIGLDKWLVAIWLLTSAKNGISSYELSRSIGITQKSAWFMLHRIRLALTNGSIVKLSGQIEADETYIGGDAKNMHLVERNRRVKKAGSAAHKTPVLGMIQRGGNVRAKVVKSRDAVSIREFVTERAETGSDIITDEWRGYHNLHDLYEHKIINHSALEYVRGNVHTNGIENFWSLFKRTLRGTYVSVAPSHLQAYVEEQAFRHNERHGKDADRFVTAMAGITGRKLTYKQLIGAETV